MKFNSTELSRVAQAVIKHNPHNMRSEAQLVAFMESLAYQHLHTGAGYVGTAGFCLIPYRVKWDNEIHVKAAIDATILDL